MSHHLYLMVVFDKFSFDPYISKKQSLYYLKTHLLLSHTAFISLSFESWTLMQDTNVISAVDIWFGIFNLEAKLPRLPFSPIRRRLSNALKFSTLSLFSITSLIATTLSLQTMARQLFCGYSNSKIPSQQYSMRFSCSIIEKSLKSKFINPYCNAMV